MPALPNCVENVWISVRVARNCVPNPDLQDQKITRRVKFIAGNDATRYKSNSSISLRPMARRIKRYDNRKLYDTETSEYVSLSDIADFVRRGETVEVVDNASGKDITAQTLTQIILEEGKSGREVLSSDLLHTMLRRSEEVLDSGLGRIRTTVDDLMERSLGRLKQLVQSPRKRELDELRQQLRRLEHRLSVLLDDVDEERPGASSASQQYGCGVPDRTAPPERADRSSQG